MGLQLISERKRKRACEATGLEIIRLLRHSNRLWMGIVAVEGGHAHVNIDPVPWDVRWVGGASPRARAARTDPTSRRRSTTGRASVT